MDAYKIFNRHTGEFEGSGNNGRKIWTSRGSAQNVLNHKPLSVQQQCDIREYLLVDITDGDIYSEAIDALQDWRRKVEMALALDGVWGDSATQRDRVSLAIEYALGQVA